MMNELLQEEYFGNSIFDYILALSGFLVALIILWVAKRILVARWKRRAEKSETRLDNFLISVAERTIIPGLYFLAFYAAMGSLTLPPGLEQALFTLTAALLTFLGVRFLLDLIRLTVFEVYIKRHPDSPELENRFRALMPLVSVLIWLIGAVFLLDNLGFEVSAVLAGLGIGGVAVAIAAAAVLGDLFAYVAIMLDRPFVLGDFIAVGDHLGSVERIGIKTTRIRSLAGEQIIMSNKDLTDSRLRNFKRMEKRRVLFKLGVTYDTPAEKMKELPQFVKKVITSQPLTQFDRAHFSSFGDFSLILEIVYFVLSPDYTQYMNTQEQINLTIMKGFEERGVSFAFPTQTLHIANFAPEPTAALQK